MGKLKPFWQKVFHSLIPQFRPILNIYTHAEPPISMSNFEDNASTPPLHSSPSLSSSPSVYKTIIRTALDVLVVQGVTPVPNDLETGLKTLKSLRKVLVHNSEAQALALSLSLHEKIVDNIVKLARGNESKLDIDDPAPEEGEKTTVQQHFAPRHTFLLIISLLTLRSSPQPPPSLCLQ